MTINDEIKERYRKYVMEIYAPELDKMLNEARADEIAKYEPRLSNLEDIVKSLEYKIRLATLKEVKEDLESIMDVFNTNEKNIDTRFFDGIFYIGRWIAFWQKKGID